MCLRLWAGSGGDTSYSSRYRTGRSRTSMTRTNLMALTKACHSELTMKALNEQRKA